MNGLHFDWCKKKNKKKLRASRTPGKGKPLCVAKPLQKYFAKRSRSYKHPEYETWCNVTRGLR